jgi:hypothetical protein
LRLTPNLSYGIQYSLSIIGLSSGLDGERMKENERYMVRIQCNQCGERFILKGRMKKGQVQTGFKKCLCDNDSDFEIDYTSLDDK